MRSILISFYLEKNLKTDFSPTPCSILLRGQWPDTIVSLVTRMERSSFFSRISTEKSLYHSEF